MLKRVVLAIVLLSSLGWISYVGYDILTEKSNYSPSNLFSGEDGELLIINRPEEVDINNIEGFDNIEIKGLISNLNDSSYTKGYFSFKKQHFLLEGYSNWTEEDVTELFSRLSSNIIFSNSDFTINEFEGSYFKRHLYLKKGDILKSNHKPLEFIYDKNSSASIISISNSSEVVAISDIYFRKSGKVDYITHNDSIEQGNQIQDEQIFSGILTREFDSYHFYERDYYSTLDESFKNGPMSKWIMNGFVELNLDGSRVIVTDYIDGQDPILILNDLNQSTDKELFKNKLMNDFPSVGKSFQIKYLEDLVVLSESEAACNKVLSDFKLGKTIALNRNVHERIYGSLPKSVSERYVSSNQSYSKAVYRGKILESKIDSKPVEPKSNKKESIAVNSNFDIQDFALLSKSGNIVATGSKGEIGFITNGKLAWNKQLESQVLGDVQVIDLHQTGESFILANTSSKIHLWNQSGHYVSGFPIDLNENATNQVKFYRWKGHSYFLIANEDNRIVHYDSKGRELNIIKSNIRVTAQIDVWASQRELYAGYSDNQKFVMYNLDKNREHRQFPLFSPIKTIKVPNELLLFGVDADKIYKQTQKGLKFEYKSFIRPRILKVISDGGSPVIIVQSANEIHLLNSEGIPFSQITLSFNEVEDVFIQTSNSGKTSVAIIDGLENNVYLYGLNGEQLLKEPREGQTKVIISSDEHNQILTTVVDQFIVQYFE